MTAEREELERKRLAALTESARRMRPGELRSSARNTAEGAIREAIEALDAAADFAGEAPGEEGRGIEDARALLNAARLRLRDADRAAGRRR